MNKRIIIHLGPPKTGTSAIQFWLSTHDSELAQQGVFYPAHKCDENNVSSGNVHQIFYHGKNVKPDINQEALAALMRQFKNSGCSTLLLSSEFFAQRVDQLETIFPDAEYIYYLRDPSDVIESEYNQSVKRHGMKLPLIKNLNYTDRSWKLLRSLLEKLGSSRLHIRPYDYSLFKGGSIVSDLLDTVGVDVRVDLDKCINPSYTFEALEFMRIANNFALPQHIEHLLDRTLQKHKNDSGPYSLIEPAAYETVRQTVIIELNNLINHHDQRHLIPFLENIQLKNQKPFREQRADEQDFSSVIKFLRDSNPYLLFELKQIITRQSEVILDNDLFFPLFNVNHLKKLPKGMQEVSAVLEKTAADNPLLEKEMLEVYASLTGIKPAEQFRISFDEVMKKHPAIRDAWNAEVRKNNPVQKKRKLQRVFSMNRFRAALIFKLN